MVPGTVPSALRVVEPAEKEGQWIRAGQGALTVGGHGGVVVGEKMKVSEGRELAGRV